jgi:hypothetical protein
MKVAGTSTSGSVLIFLFLLLNAVVPIFQADLYPFSAFPMFSESGRRCIPGLLIKNEKGEHIDGFPYGLYTLELFNPDLVTGCVPHPPPLSSTDRQVDLGPEVIAEVASRLCEAQVSRVFVHEEANMYGFWEGGSCSPTHFKY